MSPRKNRGKSRISGTFPDLIVFRAPIFWHDELRCNSTICYAHSNIVNRKQTQSLAMFPLHYNKFGAVGLNGPEIDG